MAGAEHQVLAMCHRSRACQTSPETLCVARADMTSRQRRKRCFGIKDLKNLFREDRQGRLGMRVQL
eukprot:6293517-Amphidinium_carterae.1